MVVVNKPFLALAVLAVGGLAVLGTSLAGGRPKPPEAPSYNFEVRPILAENCFGCHGPDVKANKAGLRLDTFEGATARLEDSEGFAIVPGDPDASEMLRRVLSDDPEEVMPQPESGKKLTAGQKDVLRRWIAAGAPYERHWALIPPRKVEVSDPSGWSRNGIDPFIARGLAEAGLEPAPEADKAALLRRASLALTGLPPDPVALEAFLADARTGAYERAVDAMLASDACAEHFARHWLDGARYADTHGIHIDNYRSIWPYRDWVISAFKANMRWDAFTIEQLAGDLLPSPTIHQRVATGFNRCVPTTGEGGAIPEEYLAIYAKDRVDTTATLWLGLTLGCASCHDHKFDPIATKEFYQFSAFFRNSSMTALDGNNAEHPPIVRIIAEADREELARVEAGLAEASANLSEAIQAAAGNARAWAEGRRPARPEPLAHLPLDSADGVTATIRGAAVHVGNGITVSGKGITGAGTHLANERLHGFGVGGLPPLTGKAYSWGAWILSNGKGDGAIISRMDADMAFRGIDLWMEGGKVGAHAVERWPDKASRRMTREPLPAGWHHVMAVWDATKPGDARLGLYVNGEPADAVVTQSGDADTVATAVPLRIGARSRTSGGLDGQYRNAGVLVQDVRLHERALSDSEVLDEALAPLVGPAPAGSDERARTALLGRMHADLADPSAKALRDRVRELARRRDQLNAGAVVSLVMDDRKDQLPHAHVLNRGNYTDKGEKVGPGTPAALHPFPADAPPDRLGLARWLMSRDNPLVGRVTMNRLWYQLMGTGIVETTEDLGITGARPSHPELLDWLAVEFAESGWDHRAMARLIVTSAAFRQAAILTPRKREVDPHNRLLSRGPHHRLDAEVIRDQALAASGLLVRKVGGPSVNPYQPEGIWEAVAMKESNTRHYRQDKGEALWRRSLYTFWKRTAPNPTLEILNAPSREACVVRRDRTNTPLQALLLMNDPTYVEAARALADLALETGADTDRRLDILSRRLIARDLSGPERAVARRTLDAALARFRAEPKAAEALVTVGESAPRAKDRAELAAWTLVASKLLNLDETLTL